MPVNIQEMKPMKAFSRIMILLIGAFLFTRCRTDNYSITQDMGREPIIVPDYSGITIPLNIAPMNFNIQDDGKFFNIMVKSSNGKQLDIKSSDGSVRFKQKLWRNLLVDNKGKKIEFEIFAEDSKGTIRKYDPFYMNVANEPIDPFICYRLLYPGYESWGEMKIVQRSTENFKESSLFENQLLEDNCVNCHSFIQNNPDRFLLQVRGSMGGTYFVEGKKVIRRDLRAGNMPGNAVNPSWHPSGKYVVFSSNKIVQSVNMGHERDNEIYDLSSLLVLFDIERNSISACEETDTAKYMETFPCWSPAGDYLYYCRTKQVKRNFDLRSVKYDLVRKSFDQTSVIFGKPEMVYNALEINKSVSLPSISPDGKYLVFTLHDYGTFSIWHKEADLYLLDLKSGKVDKMSLNSNETESYHSWSSNGKWLVFSSKRDDGLTSRPYFAYFGSPDNIGKPFVLPQKDPTLYDRIEETFNRPEFVQGKIKIGPRDFARASRKESVKAKWTSRDTLY